jgi:hypothetical protein
MAQLELNENEGNALIKGLDMAVKAQGLNFAADAVILVTKIQKAFQPQVKVEEKEEKSLEDCEPVECEVVTSAEPIPNE